jgi:arsenate reductase
VRSPPPRILFVCIGNMCRSPMAEAIARSLSGGRAEAHSAGLTPTGRVAPQGLAALTALGHAADGLRSKGLDEVDLADMDLVVSLLGRDGRAWLPRNLAAEVVEWSIPDPYGEDEETFVAIARLLERRITRLLRQRGLLGP